MEIHIPQVIQTVSSEQTANPLYTVQVGDTLASIAEVFAISVGELLTANPELAITSEVRPGQELKIPVGTGLVGFLPYVAQFGDSIGSIANKFGIAEIELLRANPQMVKLPLVPGQQLLVPKFDTASEIKPGLDIDRADDKKVQQEETRRGSTENIDTRREMKRSDERSNYDYALDTISKAKLQMMEALPGFGLQQAVQQQEMESGDESRKEKRNRPMLPPPFDEWAEALQQAAEKYGVEASLLAAIIWRESGGRNVQQGTRYGLFQFEFALHAEWLKAHNYGLDPVSSIDYAASLLRDYKTRYKGNLRLALAAFHAGAQVVDAHLRGQLLAETSEPFRFAFDVMTQQQYFRRFFGE